MGAISSEIVHLLKVKVSLQNDQRWLFLVTWFSKFFGGEPPDPPTRIENIWFIFQSNTAQHKPLVKSGPFRKGVNNKSNFLLICHSWAIHLLAKDLLHPFHTIIYHNMDLKIRIR